MFIDGACAMKVAKDTVVRFNYRLTNDDGTLLEDTSAGAPAAILHGHGNVIAGLERALQDRETGDTFDVAIAPEDGYGPRRDDQIQRLSKKYFHQPNRLKAGMETQVSTKDGPRPVTVVKVGGKVIDVDLNHPLAGKSLHFNISIVEVRAATATETAHGHAHADGHEHH